MDSAGVVVSFPAISGDRNTVMLRSATSATTNPDAPDGDTDVPPCLAFAGVAFAISFFRLGTASVVSENISVMIELIVGYEQARPQEKRQRNKASGDARRLRRIVRPEEAVH